MAINATDIQRLLAAAGYYKGGIDGDLGPLSQAATRALLIKHTTEVQGDWHQWGAMRQGIAALQLVLYYGGYKDVGAIDGLEGPNTNYALSQYEYAKVHGSPPPNNGRLDDIAPPTDQRPRPDLAVNEWPLQHDVTKVFGRPGGSQCTAGRVQLPYPMHIAWNKSQIIHTFSCHELVARSIERVLARVASDYSPEDIARHGMNLFSGCYNYRAKRGGSTMSMHSWGIAVDIDAERNQMHFNHTRAYLARPECVKWFEAWEAEGWVSLGRSVDYDWMHTQAARLK